MLKFDKIKLVTNVEDIEILDERQFNVTCIGDKISAMKFYQEIPYLMNIKIDFEAAEVVIEFTGKILKSDYKKLISLETIHQCFDNINEMGFCHINVDAVLNHAQIVKCDVTKDITGIDTPQLTSYIRSNLSNYQQYQCRKLRNGNLTIEKNVTTTKTMKRITIYDKGKEMNKASNIRFSQDYGITDNFDGVCRLEMNLNSKQQIRTALGISDTNIMTVLSAKANPILDFMQELVSIPQSDIQVSDKKTYLAMLVLKDNDYDLAKVEAKMREFHPRGTSISKIMETYRSILAQNSDPQPFNNYQTLIEKLCQ